MDLTDVGGDESKNQDKINDFMSKTQLSLEVPLFPEDVSSQNLTILETQKLVISKLQENVKIRRILTCSQTNAGCFY